MASFGHNELSDDIWMESFVDYHTVISTIYIYFNSQQKLETWSKLIQLYMNAMASKMTSN